MNKILEVQDLRKSYGAVQAVRDISFYVEQGKLFAFLGPNGAGKSTTIDIVCTLLQPDSGSVMLDGCSLGRDDAAIRSKIGVVFQDSILDPLLTVKENLLYRGSFYPLTATQLRQSVQDAAEAAGVTEFLNRRYGTLSGGQRRRSDIARALVNTPKLLFLDEPTTGLDPQTRQSIWDTVQKLQKETGMTVFLTTHYMEEASAADYVIIIDNGEISAKGTPSGLREQYSNDTLTLWTNAPDTVIQILQADALSFHRHGNSLSVALQSTLDALPIIEKCRPYLTNIEIKNGSMDDAFIGITGKEIRE